MIGTRLGAYEIVEELGKGGMATVYRAYHPSMERYVAVKVIHYALAKDEAGMERFRQEARLIARLEHPHLLPVYDYAPDNDPPYIVMRYLEGGTLKEVIEKNERLPLYEIVHLIRQITSALDYAHRNGIIHRDIKPSNIMVDRDGNAYLTDFGIARVMGAQGMTQTGFTVGTPGYMAPEQGMGISGVDRHADIYALGVMIFEMTTGQAPYIGETPLAVLMRHIQDPIPSALQINADLPKAIDDVLQKALAKQPLDRFDSGAELANALAALLTQQESNVTPRYLKNMADQAIQRQEKARDESVIQQLMNEFRGTRANGLQAVAMLPDTPTTIEKAVLPHNPTQETEKQPKRSPLRLILGMGIGLTMLLIAIFILKASQESQVDPTAVTQGTVSLIQQAQTADAQATFDIVQASAIARLNAYASATALVQFNTASAPSSPTVISVAELGTSTLLPTGTSTDNPTKTATATPTASATDSPTPSITASITATAHPTNTPNSPTITASPSATATASPTATLTATITASATFTASPTASATVSHTPRPTSSPSPSATLTPSVTASPTAVAGLAQNADWEIKNQFIAGVEMVLVPSACFNLGLSIDDLNRLVSHRIYIAAYELVIPSVRICIDEPFWIDRYEVTNEQFNRLDGAANLASSTADAEQPRTMITWEEAQDYCRLRAAYLPSEVEWEFAARGLDNLFYPWGNQFNANNAVNQANSNNPRIVGTYPQGASWVGADDMAGNVWEWTSSAYDYYPDTLQLDYVADNTDKIIRGGSSYDDEFGLSSFNRNHAAASLALGGVGFRCVRPFDNESTALESDFDIIEVEATLTPVYVQASQFSSTEDYAIALASAGDYYRQDKSWQIFPHEFNGVEMMLVPAGCFGIGENRAGGLVCFEKPFWIDRFEVSNEQFDRLGGRSSTSSYYAADELPRQLTTWNEARAFCELRDGRLPSEAEWEYAAKGIQAWVYPWGDRFFSTRLTYNANANNRPSAIGLHREGASWVGAEDMVGNLWEWTNSIIVPYPYDANDGRERFSSEVTSRVIRGGSYFDNENATKTTTRASLSSNVRQIGLGFRCVRDTD